MKAKDGIIFDSSQNGTYDNILKNTGSLFLGAVLIPTIIASTNSFTNSINHNNGGYTSSMHPTHQVQISNSRIIDLQSAINHLQLNELSNLKDGWNNYNGKRFDKCDIDAFLNTFDSLERQPIFNPTGRKSLYFEYVLNNTRIGYELFSNKLTEVIVTNGDYKSAVVNDYTDHFADIINSRVSEFS